MDNWRRRDVLKSGVALGASSLALTTTTSVQAVPGEQEWAFETGGEVYNSPTVVGSTVFFGCNDNNLYAVDAATGEQQWAFQTGGGISSSPTVVGGTVFFGSNDNNLYAVDVESGEQMWAFETGDWVDSSPTVVDRTVFVGSRDNNLYAVDAATGEQEWAFETGNFVLSSPTVVDSTVFVGSHDNNLYAVDTATGEQEWAFETGGVVYSSPTVVDGTVFFGCGTDVDEEETNFYAVDTTTGDQQWVIEFHSAGGSTPTVMNGTVFFVWGDTDLHAVNAETGEQQWAFDTDRVPASAPTVVGDTVFFGSNDNNLYAVDVESGEQMWAFETGGEVSSSPTVVNGTVYVGSVDGNLYAVDAGVSGSSEGARVMLGTLGHHGDWRYAGQYIDISTPTPTKTPTETRTETQTPTETPTETRTETQPPVSTRTQHESPTTQASTSDEDTGVPLLPLGAGGTLAAFGGIAAWRRFNDDYTTGTERRNSPNSPSPTTTTVQSGDGNESDGDETPPVVDQPAIKERLDEADERVRTAQSTIDDAPPVPETATINRVIEALEEARNTYDKAIETSDDHDINAAEIEERRSTVATTINREQTRLDLVEDIRTVRRAFETANDALEDERYKDIREPLDTARDHIEAVDDRIESDEFPELSEAVESLWSDIDTTAETLSSALHRETTQSLLDTAADHRERAKSLIDDADQLDPDSIEQAIDAYENARNAYEVALDLAKPLDDVDTKPIAEQRAEIKTVISRKRTRLDLINEIRSVRQTYDRATNDIDCGQFEDASDHLDDACEAIDAISARIDPDDFSDLHEPVETLQTDIDQATTRLESERDRSEVESLLDTATEHRERAQSIINDEDPDPDAIEETIDAYEGARNAYEEALDIAKSNDDIETQPIIEQRTAVDEAIDRERIRRDVARELRSIDDDLDNAEATVDDDPATADQSLAALDDRLTSTRRQAADHDLEVLGDEIETRIERHNNLTDRLETHRQQSKVTEHLEEARTHRDRGDETFTPDELLSDEALSDAKEVYTRARKAYDRALEAAADLPDVDTNAIEDEREIVADRLYTLDTQQDLRTRYDDLDGTIAAASERIDAAERDRETLEAIRTDLEDVRDTLADLATTATTEGYQDFAMRVAERRGDCEDAIATLQDRLDRIHVPPTIEGGPDITVEYNRVEKQEIAGRGGDADVHRATVRTNDGTVTIALKEPRFAGTLHTDVVDRFLDEAEMWDQLDEHDHIVDVVDWGSSPLPWIALEYMDGGTLADRLDDHSFEESVWIAQRITRAVRHAHRHGITHLDLKPKNILFRETEEGLWDVPKVSDWGLAKMLIEHSKSLDGLTPQYAAPEQVDPDRFGGTEQRTDIYQLGAVLYELFTGCPVFEGQPAKVVRQITEDEVTPPSQVDTDLPDGLDDVLLRALAKEKADRYEDILYLRDDLEDLE